MGSSIIYQWTVTPLLSIRVWAVLQLNRTSWGYPNTGSRYLRSHALVLGSEKTESKIPAGDSFLLVGFLILELRWPICGIRKGCWYRWGILSRSLPPPLPGLLQTSSVSQQSLWPPARHKHVPLSSPSTRTKVTPPEINK